MLYAIGNWPFSTYGRIIQKIMNTVAHDMNIWVLCLEIIYVHAKWMLHMHHAGLNLVGGGWGPSIEREAEKSSRR